MHVNSHLYRQMSHITLNNSHSAKARNRENTNSYFPTLHYHTHHRQRSQLQIMLSNHELGQLLKIFYLTNSDTFSYTYIISRLAYIHTCTFVYLTVLKSVGEAMLSKNSLYNFISLILIFLDKKNVNVFGNEKHLF